MSEIEFPNDLGDDYSRLRAKAVLVLEEVLALGEEKARIELFAILRQLMQEKDLSGDSVAADVISWVWLELAERHKIDAPTEYKYWPPKNFRDIANGE